MEMSRKPESSSEAKDIEVEPEAWERFERAVDVVIKSGPKHRPAKERPVSKGRVHKRTTGL
jgi:hypothetical protein